MSEINRDRLVRDKIYDSVFCDLFKDPANLLKAYQALHPEDLTTTVDDITDVTLKAVFLDQMYNDLGFMVGDRCILLLEAQSSWAPNIAVRSLMYLAESFHQYLLKTSQNYYSGKAVQLPKPELYVLYTGDTRHNEKEISLADVHWGGDSSALDVRVKVLRKDDPQSILTQYIRFTEIFKEQRRLYGKTQQAVITTIDECISNDVLKAYMQERRTEVQGIMMSLFDDESIITMFENSKIAEGREEGREAERLSSIRSLMETMKLTAVQAMDALKIPAEERKLLAARL